MISLEHIRKLVDQHQATARLIALGITGEEPDLFFWNSAVIWENGAYKTEAWLQDWQAVRAYAAKRSWANGWALEQVLRVLDAKAGIPTVRVYTGPHDYMDYYYLFTNEKRTDHYTQGKVQQLGRM